MAKRPHFTLVCKVCEKIIMQTKATIDGTRVRETRWGYCAIHQPKNGRWDHRSVPLGPDWKPLTGKKRPG